MSKSELDKSDTDLLDRPRNLDELGNSLWYDKCDYIDIEMCSNLIPNNYNLLVMQLNICSLLTHQHDLKQFL